MRVSAGGARSRRAGGAGSETKGAGARAGRFADALRKATRGAAELLAAGAAPAGRSAAARRVAADGKDAALSERRETFREDERAAPAHAAGPTPVPTTEPSTAAAPELRAVVRALPVAVEASRLREGAPLALSFGRSLDVELRPVPDGLEIVLRPEARLVRACEAELPRVVAALAARGLLVARAEVRARAPAHGEAAGPRVDLPSAVR